MPQVQIWTGKQNLLYENNNSVVIGRRSQVLLNLFMYLCDSGIFQTTIIILPFVAILNS